MGFYREQTRRMTLFSLIFLLSVLVFTAWGEEKSPPEKVSIVSWQYCFGCKQTVSLYAKLASAELQKMKRQGKPPSSMLDAGSVVNSMCDNAEWAKTYQPFVHYSCVKIMTENATQFLNRFSGSASVDAFLNKGDMYHRKRKICVKDTKACPAIEFKQANVSIPQRTKCAACHIVASEIYALSRSLAKGVSLGKMLEDDFCNGLGSNHQPYGWIEETCEEMIEERLDDVLGALDFYKQVASTGLNPSETLPEMMCKEQYKCPPLPKEQDL